MNNVSNVYLICKWPASLRGSYNDAKITIGLVIIHVCKEEKKKSPLGNIGPSSLEGFKTQCITFPQRLVESVRKGEKREKFQGGGVGVRYF